ncbi:MAG: membrane protein insertase YidC [Desulfobacterales bacterium]|nr:membrane protein insertase YidC [Desulfobacterales bacterium]
MDEQQARLLLAIALSLIVLMGWSFFFVDKDAVNRPVQETEVTEQVTEEAPPKPEQAQADEVVADAAPPVQDDFSQPARDPRTITVSSPFYSVKISEKGAVFNSFVLKKYREQVAEDSSLKEMIPEKNTKGTLMTGFAKDSVPGIEQAVFSANTESDSLEVMNNPKDVVFTWQSPKGIVFEKKFRFSPETYLIGLTITIKNGSGQTIKDDLALTLRSFVSEGSNVYGFAGPVALVNNKLERIKDIEEIKELAGNLKWTADVDKYFMSCIIPEKPSESSRMRLVPKKDNELENQFIYPVEAIPHASQQYEFKIFIGPKNVNLLSKLGYDLKEAIKFGRWGTFDLLAIPCLHLMNWLYQFIPNYGIAIIILTMFIKLLLWPLGNKGYQSMNEMKKLQPLMTEIREKYKNDKAKMNEELMKLYRTYKVNPMGGCLPMILQIPVFIAFYGMLYESIELRHAPFFLWINDLAAPDRLLNFSFSVPLMEPPYGIPVLTIIMGATMFLQQKMSPAPGDPAQAKMMMFMPIVLTVIFINFPSGLVLYWLVNNILSIAQQYHTLKKKTT